MTIFCNVSKDGNNMSAVPLHEADRCGKPATHKYGVKNRTEFFLCDEHAEMLRNTDLWAKNEIMPFNQ